MALLLTREEVGEWSEAVVEYVRQAEAMPRITSDLFPAEGPAGAA